MYLSYNISILPLLAFTILLASMTILVFNMFSKTNVPNDKKLSVVMGILTILSFTIYFSVNEVSFMSYPYIMATVIVLCITVAFSVLVEKSTLKSNTIEILSILIGLVLLLITPSFAGITLILVYILLVAKEVIYSTKRKSNIKIKALMYFLIAVSIMLGFYLNSEPFKMIYSCLLLGVILLESTAYYKRVINLFKSASVTSVTDSLTGLFNKGYLLKKTKQLSSIQPFSIIFIDIDNFKKYNDQHGHEVGDQVLINTGKILKSVIGNNGRACRYGGEELVGISILDKEGTVKLAEMFRSRIEKELNITASIGVASSSELNFPVDKLPEATINLADHRMYLAKNNGKNQIFKD